MILSYRPSPYRPRACTLFAATVLLACNTMARSATAREPAADAATERAATPPSPAPAQVLVLHNSLPGPTPPGIVDGNHILDLLGHFGLHGRLVAMADYRAGEISLYAFAIVLGDDDRSAAFPPAVLADVRRATTPVLWIRRHLHELLADPSYASKVGFVLGPEVLQGFTTVLYKGKRLTKGEPFLFPVQVKNGASVRVLATAVNDAGEERPYAVHAGNLWYFADSPFAFAQEGDRYWVFADVLHDFFGVAHEDKREALVRIEDVSAELDPKTLMKVADLLHDRDIPFQVALVPIFKKPEEGLEIHLAERPEFVHALQYMARKGGAIVMHGTTHQFRGKSTDDYELWDGLNGRAIPGDSESFVKERLRRGVEECLRNRIYPLAWETPHYMASQLDYRTIAAHFSCAYESVPSLDREDSAHQFPYPSIDRFGRKIIPESLGYIDLEKPEVELLLENADRLRVVRDGVASFFFHPFLDLEILARILDRIEALDYEFTSVRDFGCRVRFDDIVIQTHEAPVELQLEDRYLHRTLVNREGGIESETYSDGAITGTVRDAGEVPEGHVLVMEGAFMNGAQAEPERPGIAERVRRWLAAKLTRPRSEPPIVAPPSAVLLWDEGLPRQEWNDQSSYASALSAFGFAVSKLAVRGFPQDSIERDTIVVVPRSTAARLTDKQVVALTTFVHGGGRVVVEGSTPLAQALGIKKTGERPHEVRQVDDVLFGTESMRWAPAVPIARFAVPNAIATYAVDHDSELPVAVLGRHGEGRVLFLAAPLDPLTTLGYARYPYFVHYVLAGFELKLPLARAQLEMYFDPGLSNRQGVDINRLAMEWRKLGVRAIYAAAYQFYPRWSYDYARLIDACHKNGILVYAWFELPHVSQKFWDEHPECRAKTATGEDGNVGWRLHIDLDLPACQDAAFDFVEELVRAHPWDGINIAELNFDTDGGPENPSKYLPMGASTRQAFSALGGFDPILLFEARSPYYWKTNPRALRRFETYRSERVEAWHRALLRRLVPLAKERDLEIIVTMLDSLHSPTLRRDTGVDSHTIVALMNEFPFTLQVEDPEHLWADSPARYGQFTETYLRLVKGRHHLMFDLNVVPTRNIRKSHAPTSRMIGVELAQSLLFAGAASGRVGIYSEGTVAYEDLQLLSRVLAHGARVQRQGAAWTIDATGPVSLIAPGEWQAFRVDDQVWPAWGDREVLLPAGAHRIAPANEGFHFVDTSALGFRLSHLAGNLESLVPAPHGLQFTYESPSRALALFSREPSEVRVDGQLLTEPPVHFLGQWSVRLPSGRHAVDVLADSAAAVIVDTASLYSSSLIVIFGTVATALMVLLYMAILGRRAFARALQRKPEISEPQQRV